MRRWKRMAALCLSAVMAAGLLAGCAKAPEPEESVKTEENVQAADGGEEEKKEIDWMEPYEETVSVNLARVSDTVWPEGESITDNAFMNWIRDTMNIDVKADYVFPDEETLNQQIALWMASGELPDIICFKDQQLLRQLQKSGMIADLTEVYDLYASDLFLAMKDSYEKSDHIFDKATVDGRIMAVSQAASGYHFNIPWIRADWLEELGLKTPETMEELLDTARRFVEEDMAGNGKTIGIELRELAGTNDSFGTANYIFNNMGSFPQQWYDDGTGKYVYGSIASETKETLSLLHELYEQGVLAKDLPSRDWEASVAEGNCGIFFGPWWISLYPLNTTMNNDPQARWVPLEILDENGKFPTFSNNDCNGWAVVRKDYPYPEIAIKLMNLGAEAKLSSTDGRELLEGEAGKYRLVIPDEVENTYIDRKVSGINWDDWGYTISFGFDDMVPRIGQNMVEMLADYRAGELDTMNDTEIEKMRLIDDFESGRDESPEAQVEYGKFLAAQIIMDLKPKLEIQDVYYPFVTSTMETSWVNLQDLEEKAFMQIIMGEQPVDYFDTFVSEWKAQGGDAIMAEVTEMAQGG